ncbi:MAG: hypothetical protein ACOYB3_05525 [Azonexus sp.]
MLSRHSDGLNTRSLGPESLRQFSRRRLKVSEVPVPVGDGQHVEQVAI